MSSLTNFKAVYCSGIFIPEASAVSALSLLFEKVYLPQNFELIEEFARKYHFVGKPNNAEEHFNNMLPKDTGVVTSFRLTNEDGSDPFHHLTEAQKQTANLYLLRGMGFALTYKSLFPEVFETQFYKGHIDVVDSGESELEKKWRRHTVSMKLELDHDAAEFPRLLSEGYIPVVVNKLGDQMPRRGIDELSARQVASLLAMKSVEIILPKTRGVHPEVILEARERLSDHLPPFWSAMLKLSVEMKDRIKECQSIEELFGESQFLIDTLVLPALIDLQQKMLREKKDWFYKILSPIQKGLRVMVGNPPLTQQQLITNALVLGSDVLVSAAENMRTIEALKQEAGLTFLLEAQKIVSGDEAA
jgi:hypothetical protein